ncbi:response regulator [Mariprofundus erugo]|uniref:Response regulator n=1 Tax=Mariprofundus erugo TaxID=2528639 RepID=A0A5R9GMG0_9PROT|nr:response regulator [Mariprofundus erugo]TLS67571.1 response regulator [Mariprofundus erugo]TLS76234.1 response regulator [Mariprofundus erugo]
MTCVLVVDDNAMNLELVTDVLELEGFEVVSAATGEEGVELVRQKPPDLVLMDLRMPGISGLEALEIIRADGFTTLPVVVLTASVMKGERERLLELGFDGFMQKPIDPGTFAQEVASFIKG